MYFLFHRAHWQAARMEPNEHITSAAEYIVVSCSTVTPWNKAFDGLSWTDYMNRLLELKETGSWVKEVISAELKTDT